MKRVIFSLCAVLFASTALAQVPPAPSTKKYQPETITEEQKKLDTSASDNEKSAEKQEPVFGDKSDQAAEKPAKPASAPVKSQSSVPSGGTFTDTLGDGEIGGNQSAGDANFDEDEPKANSADQVEDVAAEKAESEPAAIKMGEWELFVYPGYPDIAKILEIKNPDFWGSAVVKVSGKMNLGEAVTAAKITNATEKSTNKTNNVLVVYEGWFVAPKKGRYTFSTSFNSSTPGNAGGVACGEALFLASPPKDEDDEPNYKEVVSQREALYNPQTNVNSVSPAIGGATIGKGRYKIRYLASCYVAGEFSNIKYAQQTFELLVRAPGKRDFEPISGKYIGMDEEDDS